MNIIGDKSSGTCTMESKLALDTDDAELKTGVKLRHTITSREQAEFWAGTADRPIFPGILVMFDALQNSEHPDKWPATTWTPIKGHETRYTLVPQRATEQAGEGITRRPAEIKKAVLKMTGSAMFVDVHVLFSGIAPEDVNRFVELLRGTLHTEVATGQQDLPLEKTGAEASG